MTIQFSLRAAGLTRRCGPEGIRTNISRQKSHKMNILRPIKRYQRSPSGAMEFGRIRWRFSGVQVTAGGRRKPSLKRMRSGIACAQNATNHAQETGVLLG